MDIRLLLNTCNVLSQSKMNVFWQPGTGALVPPNLNFCDLTFRLNV